VCSGCGERSTGSSGANSDITSKTESVGSRCGKESKRVCDVRDLPPQPPNYLPARFSSCPRLQERQKTEWGDRVQLHFGDMRTLELPEKVDIIITELLGSFGDNELSPECLDGAARFLKRESMRTIYLVFSAEFLFQPTAFRYRRRTPHTLPPSLRPSYSTKSGVMRI
jgi:hypothetical protein